MLDMKGIDWYLLRGKWEYIQPPQHRCTSPSIKYMFHGADWKIKRLRDRDKSQYRNYLLSDGDEGRLPSEGGLGLGDLYFYSKFKPSFRVVLLKSLLSWDFEHYCLKMRGRRTE